MCFILNFCQNGGNYILNEENTRYMVKRRVPLHIQKEIEVLIIARSVKTRDNYVWHFYQFLAYNRIGIDDFKNSNTEQLKKWISAYQNNIGDKSVSYHKSFLASVMNALTTLDRFDISLKRFRRAIPEQKTAEGQGRWIAEDIRQLVELTTDKRLKACLLLMASSGVRIGALDEMKVKDISDYKEGCKKLVVYSTSAKSRYITFVAPDGAKAIDDMLEDRRSREGEIDDESPLFVSYTKLINGKIIPKPATNRAIKQSVRNIVERFRQKRNVVIVEGQKRYKVSMAHGFRRTFKTALTEAGVEYTNKKHLLGNGLNVNEKYDSFEEEELLKLLFEDFKKALPFLAVYKERYELENKSRELKEGKDEISKLQHEKEVRIAELENLVRQQQKDLENVGSKAEIKMNKLSESVGYTEKQVRKIFDIMIYLQSSKIAPVIDWKKTKLLLTEDEILKDMVENWTEDEINNFIDWKKKCKNRLD